MTKLSREQVESLFKRAWDGELQKLIAYDFGVTSATVSNIKRGRQRKILTKDLDRPRRIGVPKKLRDRIGKLRERGLKYREIGKECGIHLSWAYRIHNEK